MKKKTRKRADYAKIQPIFSNLSLGFNYKLLASLNYHKIHIFEGLKMQTNLICIFNTLSDDSIRKISQWKIINISLETYRKSLMRYSL